MKAECPKDWYTEAEIRDYLKREGLPRERDLPAFLAKHLQLALEKGWQVSASAHANEALERAAHEVEKRCQNPLVSTRPCGGCPWCNVAAAIRALKE